MLTITIPAGELYDDDTGVFHNFPGATIQLEHSLISISKWESKWHKAFLGKADKSPEQILDYVRCMTVTQNVKDDAYTFLSEQNLKDINSYIEDDMTATHFYHTDSNKNSKEVITSELIYYWMITSNIPFECQRWHLNRLLALIEVCSRKNAANSGKKQDPKALAARNRELNAQRRAKYNSKG